MNKECGYNKAWIGACENQITDAASGRCDDHKNTVCVSCGSPATRECDSTGQFVCGAPICDECEHTIYEDGTNGGVGFDSASPPAGMGSHCKKGDQKFKTWYLGEKIEIL